MRKIIQLMSIVLVMLMLVACGSSTTSTFERLGEEKSITVEVTHSKDEVTKMKVTLKLNIPTDEPTGLAKKYMEEKLEEMKEEYDGKNVSISTDVSDKDVSMILSFDELNKDDFDASGYASITGISSIYDGDHISFDKVKNKLLDKGYSEK